MSTAAQAVLARSGRTFHLASRLLPPHMRTDAAELYSFCRGMDDLADESGAEGARLIEEAAAALEADPLSDTAASFGWPIELEARFPNISKVAVKLTRALAADTGPCRIPSEAALLEYAFGVAGTVGIMMCRILGAPPEAAQSAADLGVAMQLTNIARDVREDLGRDRIYLPADWVTPAAVKAAVAGGSREPLSTAIRRLLALAEQRYHSAHGGMHFLPWRARVSILTAAACYREIGVLVERDVPLSWRRRTVVPATRKSALLVRAVRQSLSRASAMPALPAAAMGPKP